MVVMAMAMTMVKRKRRTFLGRVSRRPRRLPGRFFASSSLVPTRSCAFRWIVIILVIIP